MSNSPLTPLQIESLRQSLTGGTGVGAAELRLINVDVYRQRLGDNWAKYKNIITAFVVEAMSGELGGNDFYVATKSGYALFFFKKDPDAVRAITSRIEKRIQLQLSNEPVFAEPPLGCQIKSVDCAAFLKQLLQDEPAQKPARPAAVPQPDIPPVISAAGTAGCKYAPLWHMKLGRIVGSLQVANPALSKVRINDQDYFAPSTSHLDNDLLSFKSLLTDAYNMHKAKQSAVIVFSINFESFCTAEYKKEYLHALRQAPAALLQYLTPRLVRIPPGAPQTLLTEKVQVLSAIFKRVALNVTPTARLANLEFMPFTMLTTSWKGVEALVKAVGQVPDAAGKYACGFVQTARALRVNAMIEGLDCPESLKIATLARADFTSGTAILPVADKPFIQQPFCGSQPLSGKPDSEDAGSVGQSGASRRGHG